MKTLKFIFILSLIIACSSRTDPQIVCQNEVPEGVAKDDSSTLYIIGLPIHFDDTKYLLFPEGEVSVYKRGSKLYFGSGSRSGSMDFTVAYASQNDINGSMHNLYVRHIDSSYSRAITNQQVRILNAEFLSRHHELHDQPILITEVIDADTNKNQRLDGNDVKALYLSQLNTGSFIKITSNLHQILDWKYIEAQRHLYFRTIEDYTKDGEFTGEDQFHYYYLELSDSTFNIVEYDPTN